MLKLNTKSSLYKIQQKYNLFIMRRNERRYFLLDHLSIIRKFIGI